jgi:hypothetical protein
MPVLLAGNSAVAKARAWGIPFPIAPLLTLPAPPEQIVFFGTFRMPSISFKIGPDLVAQLHSSLQKIGDKS